MGYADPCFQESDEAILQALVARQSHPRYATVTWEKLLAQGYARLNLPQPYLPFAEGNFPTPSGKCEFYSERMAADGYDPLPTYTPPSWQANLTAHSGTSTGAPAGDGANGYNRQEAHGRNGHTLSQVTMLPPSNAGGNAEERLLVCISPPAHSFLNSSFANMDRFLRREKMPQLQIHPTDATARQIVDGQTVRVGNDLGTVMLTAQVTDKIVAGTVLAPGIWWAKFSPEGRNINQITPQDEADMGSGACFYDTLVWVEGMQSMPSQVEDAVADLPAGS